MHRPRPVSRRLKGFLTGLVAFLPFLTGCLVGIGPRAVRQEHSMYNEQVVQTLNEQMLLNLVRLRYNDTPMFLDLGTIVAQYSVERHLNGNGGIVCRIGSPGDVGDRAIARANVPAVDLPSKRRH